MPTSTTDTSTTNTTVLSASSASPAIARFLLAQKSGGNIKKGYYGDIPFLDSQEGFNFTFGESLAILPNSPTSKKSDSCYVMIQKYNDLCKLSIFLHLCQLNYVGDTTIDVGLNTMEVCGQISTLR